MQQSATTVKPLTDEVTNIGYISLQCHALLGKLWCWCHWCWCHPHMHHPHEEFHVADLVHKFHRSCSYQAFMRRVETGPINEGLPSQPRKGHPQRSCVHASHACFGSMKGTYTLLGRCYFCFFKSSFWPFMASSFKGNRKWDDLGHF